MRSPFAKEEETDLTERILPYMARVLKDSFKDAPIPDGE